MVESQGLKRQDTVYALSCNHINEIYPWYGMPTEISEVEREDCHYSSMFDPIMSHQTNWSCGAREYIAGISRLSDTRIQTECCRVRSRDEANCIERVFAKPIGTDARVEIEHQAKLINAIQIDDESIMVRFCDLTARAIGLIMEDTTVATTPRRTTRPATTEPWISSTATATVEVSTEEPTQPPAETDPTIPKRIIKVSRPWTPPTSTSEEPTTEFAQAPRAEPKLDALKEELNKREKVQPEFTLPSATLSSSAATTTTSEEPTTTEEPSTTEAATTTTSETTTQPSTTTATEQSTTTTTSRPSTRLPKTTAPTRKPLPPAPPADMIKNIETMFPTKDYENESADEAADALMKSIAEMMDTRKAAAGLVEKAKAAGLPQLDGDALTKQLLRQVENEKDPQIADMLFKQSVEMLSTTSQSEAATTAPKTLPPRPKFDPRPAPVAEKNPVIKVLPSNHRIALKPYETSRSATSRPRPPTTPAAEPSYEVAEETIEDDANIPDMLHKSDHEQRRAPPRPVKVDEFLHRAPFDFSAFPSPPPSADSRPPPELPRKSGLVTRRPTTVQTTTQSTTTEATTEETTEYYEPETVSTRRPPRPRRPNAPQKANAERRVIVSSARGGVLTSPYVDEETNNSPFDVDRERPREEIEQGPIDLLDPQRQDPAQPDPAVEKHSPFDLSAEIRRAPKPHIQEASAGAHKPSQHFPTISERVKADPRIEFPTFVEDRLDNGAGYVEVADLNEPPRKDGSRMFAPTDNKPVDMPALIVYDAMPNKKALQTGDTQPMAATTSPIKNDLVPMNDPEGKHAASDKQVEVLKSVDEPSVTFTTVETTRAPTTAASTTASSMVNTFQEPSEQPPALFGAVQPSAATDYDDDLQSDTGGFPQWPMAMDIAHLPLKQNTPPPYDISSFYRTLPPAKRPTLREKVLTFCTKENAIRDQNNLIIACGGDTDVWYPNRCPPGTDCFVAPDSSFRICCAVGSGTGKR